MKLAEFNKRVLGAELAGKVTQEAKQKQKENAIFAESLVNSIPEYHIKTW